MISNKIILGTAQMGFNYGINNYNGQINEIDSFEILSYAYDRGISVLDTADIYGSAHEIIGKFHKNYPNKKFKITTKFPNIESLNFEKSIDKYLNDLVVDKIHVIFFHSFKSFVDNHSKLNRLNRLKNHKIDFIGVSVYTNDEISEVISCDHVDVIQVPFNLFDNSNKRSHILKKAKEKGKIVYSRSVFLQGLFFKETNDSNEIVVKLNDELKKIKNISKTNDLNLSDLALGYCLSKNYIDKVIFGVDSIKQLKSNLKSIFYNLDLDIISSIEEINVKNQNLLNPSLW